MEEINFIAFDTSKENLKLTIKKGKEEINLDIKNNYKHIETLLPLIDSNLKKIQLDKKSIKNIAVCRGPGSFTGIRIGIATALGIGYALKTNCFGFSSFEIYKYLLQNKYQNSIIIPIIDAKKERFYCSFLQKNKKITYFDLTLDEILNFIRTKYKNKKIIFAGEDFKIIKNRIIGVIDFIEEYPEGYSAKDMSTFIYEKVKKGKCKEPPHPIYIRKSDAELNFEIN